MKRNRILNILFTVLFLIAGAIAFGVYYKSVSKKNDPVYLEQTGDYDHALDRYILSAIRNADTKDFEDFKIDRIYQAQSIPSNETLIYWMLNEQSRSQEFSSAVEGIQRVSDKVHGEHFVTGGKNICISKAFEEAVQSMNLVNDKDDSTYKDIGIVTLKTRGGYTYDLYLINKRTAKTIQATLYPQSNISFPVTTDEYILSVQGRVTFPNGQKWKSLKTTIPLTGTQKQCVRTYSLKTKIKR